MLEKILSGDIRSLARAITLTESSKLSDQTKSQQILEKLPKTNKKTLKIGISGPPGAGKSTFIENFGLYWLKNQKNLAVLAVDPSSLINSGSLLGDKTRMQGLSQHPNAFVRPSPNSGHLGGLTEHTEEVISLVEAAGYETIFIESVGVGQSEVELASIADLFIVLTAPDLGDEVQGLKKGILELADLIIINKTDGQLEKSAQKTKQAYVNALKLLDKETPVLYISSIERTNFKDLEKILKNQKASPHKNLKLLESRFWQLASRKLLRDFKAMPKVKQDLPNLLKKIQSNKLSLKQALQSFFILCCFLMAGCFNSSYDNIDQLILELQSHNQKKAHTALIRLTQLANPKALDAIIEYSDRKPAKTKIQAILAARQFKDPAAIPWLSVLATGHPEESVQNAAREALTFLEKQVKKSALAK